MRNLLLLLFSSIVLFSCSDEPITQQDIIPTSVGLHGEVVVVMTQTEKDGRPGESIIEFLEAPYQRLPQYEPMFKVVFQQAETYEKFYQKHHSVITVDIRDHIDYQDGGRVKVSRDQEAVGQVRYVMGAKNWEDFTILCEERGEELANLIQDEQRKRVRKQLKRYHSKELQKVLRDTADLKIDMIKGLFLAESRDNFTWLRKGRSKNNPELQQEYYIYRTPYNSDQAFSLESLIQLRDSVLKEHVKANVTEGEMSTETRFEVVLDTINHNGEFATLMKGLWKIPAKFMGGPFVSLSFLDKESKNIITIEGNVYAPHDKKREFMREIEAIVRTAKEL